MKKSKIIKLILLFLIYVFIYMQYFLKNQYDIVVVCKVQVQCWYTGMFQFLKRQYDTLEEVHSESYYHRALFFQDSIFHHFIHRIHFQKDQRGKFWKILFFQKRNPYYYIQLQYFQKNQFKKLKQFRHYIHTFHIRKHQYDKLDLKK